MFGRICLWSSLVLDCFCYIFNFVSGDWSVQLIYFFLDLVLVGCMSLESCPFLLGCQICWHIIFHSILFFFFISALSIEISPFSFLILFEFFLSSSWWVLPEVCQYFKEPPLGLLIFFYCFLNLCFIDFLADFYEFLPSAGFRFYLPFFF